jgi:hypothetical protein
LRNTASERYRRVALTPTSLLPSGTAERICDIDAITRAPAQVRCPRDRLGDVLHARTPHVWPMRHKASEFASIFPEMFLHSTDESAHFALNCGAFG